MSFDNAQITDNLSCLNSSRQLLPYPISRHEAELHWEKTRQEVRDRIAALPSSCFEKTMLEEDERFYAAFPQARQAAINAWIAQEFPDALWASSSTYEGIGCGVLPQMDTSSVHAHPVLDFFTFTLAHALIPSPSSCLQVPALLPLTIVYDASTKTIERNSSSTDHVSPTIIVLPPHSEESYAGVSPTCARRLLSRKNCPSSCKNHPSSHPRYGMPSHRLALGRQLTFPVSCKRAKLLRDKDDKPVIACLFCHDRKIACGPPPAGSDDPTCNQCACRGLACHYPAESRRGQRKRKTAFIDAQSNDLTTLLKGMAVI